MLKLTGGSDGGRTGESREGTHGVVRVLVIDDDAGVLEVLRLVLTEEGHDVRAMPDGPSGVALAQEDPPDVAILDFRMPGMSGVEVLRALKRLRPSLPVFFHTVYGDFGGKSELDEADYCFVKSSDLSPVIKAVARAVGP